jgi:hypothetical protein
MKMLQHHKISRKPHPKQTDEAFFITGLLQFTALHAKFAEPASKLSVASSKLFVLLIWVEFLLRSQIGTKITSAYMQA